MNTPEVPQPSEDWPGGDRRKPRLLDRHYLALRGLALVLRSTLHELLDGRAGLAILDVGCGVKPYYPWLAPHAASYVGVDAYPAPGVDRVAPAEALDFVGDASIDVVLSTQTLEHVENPAAVAAEMRRVLRPGGVALVSTHGVFPYHGQPLDYWRWTHLGLAKVFRDAGFASVEVRPTDGIASALGELVAFYSYALTERLPLFRFLRFTLHPLLGFLAPRLDRYASWLFEASPMSINYLVVARVGQAP